MFVGDQSIGTNPFILPDFDMAGIAAYANACDDLFVCAVKNDEEIVLAIEEEEEVFKRVQCVDTGVKC